MRLIVSCTLAAASVLGTAAASTDGVDAAQAAPGLPHAAAARPRIALVLSGGGARGLAHIGVLRVLQELRVPVDMVVGTSMGGVIGGAYAAGASVADLERMARQTDWERVMADRPGREQLAFRRREEDLVLPSRIEFGVGADGLALPPSAAGNAALEHTLTKLLPAGTRDRPVSQLALPFRSVASDLVSGEPVDLIDTPLFQAVRASIAVPGVFAPVRVDGRLVVDGGLVRNLPVDLAHKMGADIVIAVNVGTPLAPEKSLVSALGVAQQMINILTEQNVQRSLKELRNQDVLIAPNLAEVSFLDFSNVGQAIRAGEEAARAMAARLAPLALEPDQYARIEAARVAPPGRDGALPIGRVTVQTDGRINPKALEVQTGLSPGQSVTQGEARSAAEALYGRGDLQSVQTDIVDRAGRRDVAIKAVEAPWASSRLRVGLELGSDFDDANNFALKLMHVRTSMNSWGGELRTLARVGDVREFSMQFHQPLGVGSRWYVAPYLEYGAGSFNHFFNGRRSGRIALDAQGGGIVLGRELGTWGDIQIGTSRQRTDARSVIPDDGRSGSTRMRGKFLRYRIDTLDSLAFPGQGVLIDAALARARTRLHMDGASDSDPASMSTSATVVAMKAFHTSQWAGHLYWEMAQSSDDDAGERLGGFLRLSGTPADSVGGRHVTLARLVMARRIGALPMALGGTVRAGFSLEAGGGFDPQVRAPGSPFKQAASGFFSVDTRFGPAYLGAGATREGAKTLYIYLGPIW